ILANYEHLSRISNRNRDYWAAVMRGDLDLVQNFHEHPTGYFSVTPRRGSIESSESIVTPKSPGTPLASTIHTRDYKGNTSIHIACRYGQKEILEYLLIKQGWDP